MVKTFVMPREWRASSREEVMRGIGEVEKKRVRLGLVRWVGAMERADCGDGEGLVGVRGGREEERRT